MTNLEQTLARPRSRTAVTRVKAPATCGELMQGWLDGRDFLVNCPIDLYAYATVDPAQTPGLHVDDPQNHEKIERALALLTERVHHTVAHRVALRSRIPRGKGMASSTADLTAALLAVCRTLGVTMSPGEFSHLLTRVEPSDCTHFPGIAHVNHLTGELYGLLEPPGDVSVLVVDCGGEVDTVGFDREKARAVYRDQRDRVLQALRTLERGLGTGDERLIGLAATRSTELSQSILRKRPFEDMLAISLELGALGINCGHSGTVLGVLHRTSDALGPVLGEAIERWFGKSVEIIGDHHVISGGALAY